MREFEWQREGGSWVTVLADDWDIQKGQTLVFKRDGYKDNVIRNKWLAVRDKR